MFGGSSGGGRRLGIAVAILVCLAFAEASGAGAAVQIESFEVTPSTTQVGAYPDLTTSLAIAEPHPPESVEAMEIFYPELVVIPHAVPGCSSADFNLNECSPDSQAGLVTMSGSHEAEASILLGTVPLYSLDREGAFGRVGFKMPVVGAAVTAEISLRSIDGYWLGVSAQGFPQSTPVTSMQTTLWGVPGSGAHDGDRFPKGAPGSPPECPGLVDAGCVGETQSTAPLAAYLQRSAGCDDLVEHAELIVWSHEDAELGALAEAEGLQGTGCDQISFNPSITVGLGEKARSGTGLELQLRNPHPNVVTSPQPSPLRALDLDFVRSLDVNEQLAASHDDCTLAEAGFDDEGPAACSEAARVGSLEVEAAMLPGRIEGDVFYGPPTSGAYPLILVASGFGFTFQEVAFLESDPASENVFASVWLPAVPIEELDVQVSASSELLRTGLRCAGHSLEAILMPGFSEASGAPSPQLHEPTVTFTEEPDGSPCPGPASDVDVALEPGSIAADGRATTTATVRVVDGAGRPIIGEDVEVTSSDGGQGLGAVRDGIDGTYAVEIVASHAPGPVTITAIDRSVDPPISGSAVLQQTGPGGPVVIPMISPRAKITKRPPRRTRRRTVVFRVESRVGGSRLFCSLDKWRFRRCGPRVVYRRLSPGAHRFRVFAKAPDGKRGKTTVYRFRVLRRR